MKQPGFLIKVAAVASSVLLVGVFVSYRAGAFNWLVGTDTNEPKIMGGSKYKVLFEPTSTAQETPAGSASRLHPAFMYGSKSIIFVDPACSSKPVAAPSGESKASQ